MNRSFPLSTYRLQLGPDFDFAEATRRLPYIDSLGATHLYLSPILEAAPGSTHGYDVVDHGSISPVLGGREGFDRLAEAARDRGLGIVLDVVPNHMAVPTPLWHNRALWAMLAKGAEAATAHWFDVDWQAGDGALLLPILGERIGDALAAGDFELDELNDEEARAVADLTPSARLLRYREHCFPVRLGTESLPMAELLERQHYRLAWWQIGDEHLNYRRFFDIDTLAAIRVEQQDVFEQTHAVLFELLDAGQIDGLRIDHPDGLADPKTYLERLAERTDSSWVVVEKILAADESLPSDWRCAGTTGYDLQWRIQLAFTDASGATELGFVMHEIAGDAPGSLDALQREAKVEVLDTSLAAELQRLVVLAARICDSDIRLRDHAAGALRDALVALLRESDRYRYYILPDEPMSADAERAFEAAVARARETLDEGRQQTLDVLAQLLRGAEAGSAGKTHDTDRLELLRRFQQVQGAVLAKGVEDTSFYRWTHLVGLNEVGGAPERFGIEPDELHAAALNQLTSHPSGMTCLSTHDTKRSEDVRARLAVLSELPEAWSSLLRRLRRATETERSPRVDGRIELLLWQTLAACRGGSNSLEPARLRAYLVKAMREAKTHTSWRCPDSDYESAVLALLESALASAQVEALLTDWAIRTAVGVRANCLGMKLVQLTLPGVADVYQGSEAEHIALVDPDNRRAVNFDALERQLDRLDAGEQPTNLSQEKQLVTAAALRARRELAEAFIGPAAGYRPLPSTSAHALAFMRLDGDRPRCISCVTRLALRLDQQGGWQAHEIVLPEGHWLDRLTGKRYSGGSVALAQLFQRLPVALLVAAPE